MTNDLLFGSTAADAAIEKATASGALVLVEVHLKSAPRAWHLCVSADEVRSLIASMPVGCTFFLSQLRDLQDPTNQLATFRSVTEVRKCAEGIFDEVFDLLVIASCPDGETITRLLHYEHELPILLDSVDPDARIAMADASNLRNPAEIRILKAP